MKSNYKLLSVSLFAIMVIGTITNGAFSSAYAGEDNHHKNGDKVKVDCKDTAITLATLALALGDLDEEGFNELEDELQEGEIADNVDEIRDNFQNVLDKVEDKCEDVDFVGFVDFEEEDFTE